MPDKPLSAVEAQRTKYVEDMAALQATLEKQPGLLGKLFASIGQFFTGFLPHVGKAIMGVIPDAINSISLGFKAWVAKAHEEDAAFLKARISKGDLTPELGTYIQHLLDSSKEGEPFLMFIYLLLLSLGELGGFMRVYMDDAQQAVNRRVMNTLPDPATAIKAMFLDPRLEAKAREVLKRYGMTPERSDMMIAAARSQLDPGTLQALYHRGEITEEELARRLRGLGYTDSTVELMRKTWEVIPGPQDIIRMAVREAFSEDQVTALGLDEAFPAAVEEWAAKVGLKAPWPKMFWRAHWELPSPNMGFEMLHRGLISESELGGLLKALDYSPVWHGRLQAIAYNVVTRVDARRLYDLGIWTEEQLTEAYRKMGYAPQDADDLTAWTKVEYAQNDKEVSRTTVEGAYRAGIIDRREAQDMIVSLGWSEEKADWILDLADFGMLSEARTQAIGTAKELYLAGLSTAVEVRGRLAGEQVQADYIEALLERWEAEKLARRKLPSKTDLDKFLKAGLIVEGEYKGELERLGYSTAMADRYYRLNTQ